VIFPILFIVSFAVSIIVLLAIDPPPPPPGLEVTSQSIENPSSHASHTESPRYPNVSIFDPVAGSIPFIVKVN